VPHASVLRVGLSCRFDGGQQASRGLINTNRMAGCPMFRASETWGFSPVIPNPVVRRGERPAVRDLLLGSRRVAGRQPSAGHCVRGCPTRRFYAWVFLAGSTQSPPIVMWESRFPVDENSVHQQLGRRARCRETAHSRLDDMADLYPMKKLGFLSFGHWAPSPQSRTQSGSDALPAVH
jgi:hypothetical protein